MIKKKKRLFFGNHFYRIKTETSWTIAAFSYFPPNKGNKISTLHFFPLYGSTILEQEDVYKPGIAYLNANGSNPNLFSPKFKS